MCRSLSGCGQGTVGRLGHWSRVMAGNRNRGQTWALLEPALLGPVGKELGFFAEWDVNQAVLSSTGATWSSRSCSRIIFLLHSDGQYNSKDKGPRTTDHLGMAVRGWREVDKSLYVHNTRIQISQETNEHLAWVTLSCTGWSWRLCPQMNWWQKSWTQNVRKRTMGEDSWGWRVLQGRGQEEFWARKHSLKNFPKVRFVNF